MNRHVYNLSYDISGKEANKQNLSKEARLEYGNEFIEFLYDNHILLLEKVFKLRDKNGNVEAHEVIKPVESTIIFISAKKREEICSILNTHKDLSYVLTDITQTNKKNIGTLKCVGENKEFQEACDKKLEKLQSNTYVEELAKEVAEGILAKLQEAGIELEIEIEE